MTVSTSQKKLGRPEKLPPAFVEREFAEIAPANAADVIERMASEGSPLALIARALGTGAHTLRRWRRQHATLQEAYEVGRAQLEHELYKEVRHGKGEYSRPMFLLKTMFHYRETGDAVDNVNQVQVNINLPGSMTLQAFREIRNGNGQRSGVDSGERLPSARPGITARA